MQSVRTLIRSGEDYLLERGVPNARRNAEWMLSHAVGCRNTDLYVRIMTVADAAQISRFEAMLERRGRREPLQYVLSSTEFMSLPFESRPGVFIPRPDTEILVETMEAQLVGRDELRICDLCCGSGAIAVALASRLAASVVAVDLSAPAASLTQRNAELNGVDERVLVIQGDALRFAEVLEGLGPFDAIVANPPYVPTAEIVNLPPEIRDHEPLLSLDGGADGLDFYRGLVPQLASGLKPNGMVGLEIGDSQSSAVSGLLRDAGFKRVAVHTDYNGHERAVSARLK